MTEKAKITVSVMENVRYSFLLKVLEIHIEKKKKNSIFFYIHRTWSKNESCSSSGKKNVVRYNVRVTLFGNPIDFNENEILFLPVSQTLP